MNSRRSFLRILGLGAVAAPVAVRVAMEAPALPEAISPGARSFFAAVGQYGGDHTHTITPAADVSHTHTISRECVWVYDGKNWAMEGSA